MQSHFNNNTVAAPKAKKLQKGDIIGAIQFYRQDSNESREDAINSGSLRSVFNHHQYHSTALDILEAIAISLDCMSHEAHKECSFNVVLLSNEIKCKEYTYDQLFKEILEV